MKFHLLLWLFLISLSFNVFVVTSHCLGHQQSLLLHLKSNLSFNSAKSKKLLHWNQTADCCQWNGVTCNNGRVIGLDLSEEFITGGLENTNSLFNLQYLQNLSLAYNDFNSVIPSEVGKLKRLRSLNLSNAGFKGQIPIEMSHLKRLVVLDMSTFNYVHALKLEKPNLGLLLQNLKEIKELILDGVSVFSKGMEWSHALSFLKNLEVLSMSSCNLSGPIDSSLARLQSLSLIRLNRNNMSSPVPDFFANFSNLITLHLSSCGLRGVFPNLVFHIQSLRLLDLSNNQDLHGSLPNFPKHASLHALNLSNTNFLGLLPDSIHNLRQLTTLDLSKCRFNGTLPEKMMKLTQLVHVDLSLNNFTGPLPSFILSKNLTYLSLYHNDFQGSISLAHLESLTNLVGIDLSDNSLNGNVPSSLFTLPSLRKIILSNNHFDGLLEDFPNASSSPIEIIDLSRNNIHGLIPMSIFHLRRLTSLQLSLNKLNGTIRLEFIQRLGNLSTLDLSHNNLSVDAIFKNDQGSSFPNMIRNLMLASCNLKGFPNFLRSQFQLLNLDLSRNQIQGEIPNWISQFEFLAQLNLSHNFLTNFEEPFQFVSSNLIILDLSSNQLQGPIHIFPKYAIYLDYSSNNLSSIIPNDIGNEIPFIFFFSVSNNSLFGEIHASFCNASSLRVLDLSYNNFNGTFPECLTSNDNLRVLKLEGNKLVGHISDSFSSSCALRFLDLTGNLLSGTIPKSFSNCQMLRVLNVGHNMLTDEFPCHLRIISTLRVLILRSNKLYGPIGCPNDIGNWKMLQIVDLAANEFFGDLPTMLLRAWTSMKSEENEARPKFSVSDMYDVHDPVEFIGVLSIANKDLGKIAAKFAMVEPRSLVEYEFSNIFYEYLHSDQVAVTVVNKGQEVKLVKIITSFTSVDFSSNHFAGPIPKELMNLEALHALNLSHNAFSGCIPSSIGNLKHLESLDLSFNSLSGEIPAELSALSFLAFLNLSFNHFVGEVPTGTQIQSFDATSFEGNEGLCGPPLTPNCSTNNGMHDVSSQSTNLIDWNFLSAELGFIFGLGLIILPLIFWRQWRLWYCKLIDDILLRIFPQLAFVYEVHGSKTYGILRWRPY